MFFSGIMASISKKYIVVIFQGGGGGGQAMDPRMHTKSSPQ